MTVFKRPGEGNGPANYMRSGLTNEELYRSMSSEWQSTLSIASAVKWIPSPEYVERFSTASHDRRRQSAVTKIHTVQSKLMVLRRHGKTESLVTPEGIKWRLTEDGKARLKTIEDQARRKHATTSRARKPGRV